MTAAEKLALLKRWREQHRRTVSVWESAKAVLGAALPESELFSAHWAVFQAYTDAVATLLGDRSGWLDWYCYDDAMGKKGLAAGPTGRMRHIKSLRDLLWLIEAVAE